MDNRLFAKHLRKPEGEEGKVVGIVMNKTNEYMNRYTYNSMNILTNDEVLEIGFGNGKFISELYENNKKFNYTGIEISEIMMEEAQKNIPTHIEDNVNLMIGSQDKIDFEDSTFDKICTINTFYFWNEPIDYLLEINRVLKIGGVFFLAIRSKIVLENQDFTKYYFQLYQNEEIKEMLESAGFSHICFDKHTEPDNSALDVILISCTK